MKTIENIILQRLFAQTSLIQVQGLSMTRMRSRSRCGGGILRGVLLWGMFLGLFFGVEVMGQMPTLGIYGPTTVTAGGNTSVVPNVAPTNATRAVAYVNTNFEGILTVDPVSGIVRVTNAKPAGSYVVTVKVFNGGGNVSTTFTLLVSDPVCSQGDVRGSNDISVVGGARSIAIGDFNGDEIQDFVTANYDSNTVSTYLGDGLGGFGFQSMSTVGSGPIAVAIGDFNGDGMQDVATANQGSNAASICFGDGLGGFSGSTNLGVGLSPISLAIGDLNSDGNQDLVIVCAGEDSVSICLGNGLGGFGALADIGIGHNLHAVAIGDFDRDGHPDLAVTYDSPSSVAIRFGDGFGGFSGTTDILGGWNLPSVAIGDLNSDGNQDLAVASEMGGAVLIGLGDQWGTFGTPWMTLPIVAFLPLSCAIISDCNGDGNQDIVAANLFGMSVRLGDGLGGFVGAINPTIGSGQHVLATGDFNGDGMLDIACSNLNSSDVFIRLGALAEIDIMGNQVSISDGDTMASLTNDTHFGSLEVGTSNVHTYTIHNTGNGRLTLGLDAITLGGSDTAMFQISGISFPISIPPSSFVTFDVTFAPASSGLKTAILHIANDDCGEAGYDFMIQGQGLPGLGSYSNVAIMTGSNTLIAPNTAPTSATCIVASTNTNFSGVLTVDSLTGTVRVTNAKPAGTYLVTVQAFDGVVSNSATFNLVVTDPSCSQGNFTDTTNFYAGSTPGAIAVGDFNEDGKQDLASTNGDLGGTVLIHEGNGTGTFSTLSTIGAVGCGSLSVGDFNGDGHQDIATVNISSNKILIRRGNGLGGLMLAPDIVVGGNPHSVAAGDFNGDGKKDLVAANFSDNTVSLRLQSGVGGFGNGPNIHVGMNPWSIAVADFDNDGNQDFVVTNYTSNTISIRNGDGFGGFNDSAEVAVGVHPWSIAIGDLNGDGLQDFVTANGGFSISICIQDSFGTFPASTNLPIPDQCTSVAINDFDGDGDQDLAVTKLADNEVSVLYGDGYGNFMGLTQVPVGAHPGGIAVGDFNQDGKYDFALANNNSNTISVRMGAGPEIDLYGNAHSIMNNDASPSTIDSTDVGLAGPSHSIHRRFVIKNIGTTDLLLDSISVYGNDATMFTMSGIVLPDTIMAFDSVAFEINFAPTSLGLKTATIHIANNDCDEGNFSFGIQGLSIPWPTLGTYPTTSVVAGGNTTVTPSTLPTNATSAVAYTNTPFSGIFTVNPTTGIVGVTDAKPAGIYPVTVQLFGNGVETTTTTFMLHVIDPYCTRALFSDTSNVHFDSPPTAIAIGDFNGDHNQDLAIGGTSSSKVYIRLGDGQGNFNDTTNISLGPSVPSSLAVGDLNGDGIQDLAIADGPFFQVETYLGDGLGNFNRRGQEPVIDEGIIALGEFNGDGRQDLACANSNTHQISIKWGTSTGPFIGASSFPVGGILSSVKIGDFNGDGKQDFAASIYSADSVVIQYGDGLGGFGGNTMVPVGLGPTDVAIGDFNEDGKQDIACANSLSNDVSIRIQDSLGGFRIMPDLAVGLAPRSIASGDFNGDGKEDLIVANAGSNDVTLLFGDGSGNFGGSLNLTSGVNPWSIVVGDFNNDEIQDFANCNRGSNNVSIRLGVAPHLQVSANYTPIVDGDATPAIIDNTDFGGVPVPHSLAHAFQIENLGTADLIIDSITITGIHHAMFVDSGLVFPYTLPPGGIVFFQIRYTPAYVGVHGATVHLFSNTCNSPYIFDIEGRGGCQASVFCPPAQTLVLNTSCTATLGDYRSLWSSNSFCIPQTVTQTQAPGSTLVGVGTTTVTLDFTFLAGNPSACTFVVNRIDVAPPAIVCPHDTTVINRDTAQCGAVFFYPAATATDFCAGVTPLRIGGLVSGATFPVGSTVVTWRAVDPSGNAGTCSFTVTVEDSTPPRISCPPSTTIFSNIVDTCGARYPYQVFAIDNCSGATATWVSGRHPNEIFQEGITQNVWRATDTHGNTATCTFSVRVNDIQAPRLICPASKDTIASPGTCGTPVIYAYEAKDNCGMPIVSCTGLASGLNFHVGTHLITLMATDSSGNTASCSFTVTVRDQELPIITCPTNISVSNDVGMCGAFVTYGLPIGADNCGSVSITQLQGLPSGALFPNSTVFNLFQIEDSTGNTASCSFTVTVIDSEPPVFVCPSNIVLSSDTNSCSAVCHYADSIAVSDNCGLNMVQTQGFVSGATFPVGTTSNRFLATDQEGNTATCDFDVTVIDSSPPHIICPQLDTVIFSNNYNDCSAYVSYLPYATDNCSSVSVIVMTGGGSGIFPVGTTTNTLVATDASGNSSMCTFNITVKDAQNPTIVCPPHMILSTDTNSCSRIVPYSLTISDNCPGWIVTQDTGYVSGAPFLLGTTLNSFTVMDIDSNYASCYFSVTIVDSVPPVARCRDLTLSLDANGIGSTNIGNVDNGSSDNCAYLSMSLSQGIFTCADIGANIVVLTVTDGEGNDDTCSGTIMVLDTLAPIPHCTDVTILLDSNNIATITPAQIGGLSTDNCQIDPFSLVLSRSVFNCADAARDTISVTFSLSDLDSNSSSCVAIITIQDPDTLVASCHDTITVWLDAMGHVHVDSSLVDNASFDNCGIDEMTLSRSDFWCTDIGYNHVSLLVESGSGDTARCGSVIHVSDDVPPTARCQDITVTLNSQGYGTIDSIRVNDGSLDACTTTPLRLSLDVRTVSCADFGQPVLVTLTVTDADANTATCQAHVAVKDVTPPIPRCRPVIVYLDNLGSGTTTAIEINDGSYDACTGIASLQLSRVTFGCSDIGETPGGLTLTVMDNDGNTSTCAADLFVLDTVPPIAVCQNITISLDNTGMRWVAASAVLMGVTDYCSQVSATDSVQFGYPSGMLCAEAPYQDTLRMQAPVGTVFDLISFASFGNPTGACGYYTSAPCDDTLAKEAIGGLVIGHNRVEIPVNYNLFDFNACLDSARVQKLIVQAHYIPISPKRDSILFDCVQIGKNGVVLSITDDEGNESTCSAIVTVLDSLNPDPCVHPSTTELDSLFLYPNPAQTHFFLGGHLPVNVPVKVTVIDALGQYVMERSLPRIDTLDRDVVDGSLPQVDVPERFETGALSNGVYFVRVVQVGTQQKKPNQRTFRLVLQ